MRPSYEGKEMLPVFGQELWLMAGGYLRRRPDRATEATLRALFADLDSELAAILGDLQPTGMLDGGPAGRRQHIPQKG
jgi:hypothetical protein